MKSVISGFPFIVLGFSCAVFSIKIAWTARFGSLIFFFFFKLVVNLIQSKLKCLSHKYWIWLCETCSYKSVCHKCTGEKHKKWIIIKEGMNAQRHFLLDLCSPWWVTFKVDFPSQLKLGLFGWLLVLRCNLKIYVSTQIHSDPAAVRGNTHTGGGWAV